MGLNWVTVANGINIYNTVFSRFSDFPSSAAGAALGILGSVQQASVRWKSSNCLHGTVHVHDGHTCFANGGRGKTEAALELVHGDTLKGSTRYWN